MVVSYESPCVQNMDELDLSGFYFGGMNITGFRLMSSRIERLKNFQQEWRNLDPVLWPEAGTTLSVSRH